MKISYQWLQDYFDQSLPNPEKIAEALTFHTFEIESVESVGGDTVIDVDVLPNRSSDCLSHRGIAKELSVILDIPLKIDPLREEIKSLDTSKELAVDIENPKLCRRYSAAVIQGVKVRESPEWLKERLKALGQKSINNIVDVTNYVMFDLGQPIHAFDKKKLNEEKGKTVITTRSAKEGEHITTLDGEEHSLSVSNLLITDGISNTPIGIAGVKGGKITEINNATTDIIIESANFDPLSVRKTSRELKLRTDASARFENDPPQELTLYALRKTIDLIQNVSGGELEGGADVWPKQPKPAQVGVTLDEINDLLGSSLSENEVKDILSRFGWIYTNRRGNFTIDIPFERLDLRIKEDLIEEVGRVYGYENISPVLPPKPKESPKVNKRFYYAEKIRHLLKEKGFSEVYTYTLKDRGEIELANPLAEDKSFLRADLASGIEESLNLNIKNTPLLGFSWIRIFEIGTVFKTDKEHLSLALGAVPADKVKSPEQTIAVELNDTITSVFADLGVSISTNSIGSVTELNLDELIEKLTQPESYTDTPIRQLADGSGGKEILYKPISLYPFVLRDIAVWTPSGTKPEGVLAIIRKEAGELLVNHTLFDTFEKEGKISYAFHLVFQSSEKTLSDEEVNVYMEKVTKTIQHTPNWEVR